MLIHISAKVCNFDSVEINKAISSAMSRSNIVFPFIPFSPRCFKTANCLSIHVKLQRLKMQYFTFWASAMMVHQAIYLFEHYALFVNIAF